MFESRLGFFGLTTQFSWNAHPNHGTNNEKAYRCDPEKNEVKREKKFIRDILNQCNIHNNIARKYTIKLENSHINPNCLLIENFGRKKIKGWIF